MYANNSERNSRRVAFLAANACEAKKGRGTVVLDIRQITCLADYFVIVGGETTTQVKAIAETIDQELSQMGFKVFAIEGKSEGRWVLLDFGLVIVHVFLEKERDFYKLEQFWNHALVVPIEEWSSLEVACKKNHR